MTNRFNPYELNFGLVKPLIDCGNAVQAGLEKSLNELVKIRASQINGCAVCLHMHAAEARKAGETDERMLMLDAFRESPLFSAREKAALAWTEALTLLTRTHAPDAVYEEVAEHFTPEEMISLTLMIGVINAFNRIGVGFRLGHQPSQVRAAA